MTIYNEVQSERERQDEKWGEQNHHPYRWMSIIGEEFGETCKAVIEGKLNEYRAEFIQLAAVCVDAIESCDRACANTVDEEIGC